MNLLGIRFCAVAGEAPAMSEFFTKGLGLAERDLGDDADAIAALARENGIDVQGPMEAHGEKIYFAVAPGVLSVSFQQVH